MKLKGTSYQILFIKVVFSYMNQYSFIVSHTYKYTKVLDLNDDKYNFPFIFYLKTIFLKTLLLSNQYIEYFTVFVHLFWPKIHQKENLIYLNKILEKKKLCSLSTLYIKSFSLYLLHLLCSSLSGVSNFPHCEFVLYKIRCSFINYTMHDELL